MNLFYFWSMILLIISLMMFMVFMLFIELDYSLFLDWFILELNSCSFVMTMLLDWMSILFMSCVFMISSMVILYSKDYMSEDKYKYRFLMLVLLFIMSMMLLIISPNMVSILLGWDGLGLVSYSLVIYFGNYKSYNAGMLTILINRIGDVSILMSLYFIFNWGSWNFSFHVLYMEDWTIYIIYLVILASFTKSAQIPFSSWLPAAMAAPTPVSSLVHSSTLVTAGVYLMIRFNFMLMKYNLSFLILVSLLTMFMAGLGANFEYDLKSIIALSTLSQLGMMMLILLLGGASISYFHLLTHAFFKALLFLCGGLIIHCMNDSQDIRHMGNLVFQMPYTCSCFCISTLSLCGIPFMSGFYSKDMIMEYSSLNYTNLFIYIMLFISVGFTASYSMRLIFYCISNLNGLFTYQSCLEEKNMLLSMLFLTVLSILGGSVLMWLLFPFDMLLMFPSLSKLMPMIFVLSGMYLGYELSFVYWFSKFNLNYMSSFMGSMWFMHYLSTGMIISGFLLTSKLFSDFNDYMWGEYMISRMMSYYNYNLFMNSVIMEKRSMKIYLLLFLTLLWFMVMVY
uniref:NADH-ubiquinone oxidoreductase chain 5 n=1 Tax=Urochela quadrinotata TaxID=1176167 RepID=L7NZW3_UROQU|nr:NADH dehydrogenase subunit 5 [Urochela quadrinotata]AFI54780.1 NADH dehydrogenase subunit 5 [Urochela quadrinotata]